MLLVDDNITGLYLYCGHCVFFFQAEDGIRDLTVTGVQTCALPIFRCIDLGMTLDEAGQRLKPNGEYWLKGEAMLRERLGRFDEAFRNARAIADSCRSEERRGGEEGRSRWSPDH